MNQVAFLQLLLLASFVEGLHSCSHGDIRLRGGSKFYGRVEVCANNTWGTICDREWDHNEARVVCNQLNLTSPDSVINGVAACGAACFGEGQGKVHYKDVECGDEHENLSECPNGTVGGGGDCRSHSNDAGVICAFIHQCENETLTASNPATYQESATSTDASLREDETSAAPNPTTYQESTTSTDSVASSESTVAQDLTASTGQDLTASAQDEASTASKSATYQESTASTDSITPSDTASSSAPTPQHTSECASNHTIMTFALGALCGLQALVLVVLVLCWVISCRRAKSRHKKPASEINGKLSSIGQHIANTAYTPLENSVEPASNSNSLMRSTDLSAVTAAAIFDDPVYAENTVLSSKISTIPSAHHKSKRQSLLHMKDTDTMNEPEYQELENTSIRKNGQQAKLGMTCHDLQKKPLASSAYRQSWVATSSSEKNGIDNRAYRRQNRPTSMAEHSELKGSFGAAEYVEPETSKVGKSGRKVKSGGGAEYAVLEKGGAGKAVVEQSEVEGAEYAVLEQTGAGKAVVEQSELGGAEYAVLEQTEAGKAESELGGAEYAVLEQTGAGKAVLEQSGLGGAEYAVLEQSRVGRAVLEQAGVGQAVLEQSGIGGVGGAEYAVLEQSGVGGAEYAVLEQSGVGGAEYAVLEESGVGESDIYENLEQSGVSRLEYAEPEQRK